MSKRKKIVIIILLCLLLLISALFFWLYRTGRIFNYASQTEEIILKRNWGKIYQASEFKLTPSDLISPLKNNILIENKDSTSKIYLLSNKKLVFKSSFNSNIAAIISLSRDKKKINNWLALSVESTNEEWPKINQAWTSQNLAGPWLRDPGREAGFGNEARLGQMAKDVLDNYFVVNGHPGRNPHYSLDGMGSWDSAYQEAPVYAPASDLTSNYLYFGGEAPLDVAYLFRAKIERQGDKVMVVDLNQPEDLLSSTEKEKIGNRRVRNILVKDGIIIASGEGWIGWAPESRPKNNWQFSLFNPISGGEEYLYSEGMMAAKDLILVFGYNKTTCAQKECLELKISKDNGRSFIAAENRLRDLLSSNLPKEPYTEIKYLSYDETSDCFYFVITNQAESKLFYLNYNLVKSWL